MYVPIGTFRTPYFYIRQSPFSQFLSSDQTKRIKEIALDCFIKASEFFAKFKLQSNETNIKAMAMISCLSLIALLVISMLRRRDHNLMPPPTPIIK